MMLTREQAAATWCPMTRLAAIGAGGVVAHGQSVFNRLQNARDTSIPDSSICIADRCAMWRWLGPVGAASSRLGYCGLAGAPVAQGGAA